jgi:hypothetical protein
VGVSGDTGCRPEAREAALNRRRTSAGKEDSDAGAGAGDGALKACQEDDEVASEGGGGGAMERCEGPGGSVGADQKSVKAESSASRGELKVLSGTSSG